MNLTIDKAKRAVRRGNGIQWTFRYAAHIPPFYGLWEQFKRGVGSNSNLRTMLYTARIVAKGKGD